MNIDNATAKRVPHGYHTITPWIITKHAADLIAFLARQITREEALKRIEVRVF